jgi:hypothetical protein
MRRPLTEWYRQRWLTIRALQMLTPPVPPQPMLPRKSPSLASLLV